MNKMVIVVAPSGAGKSTFIKELIKKSDLGLKYIITHTTRKLRSSESEGNPYFFIDKEDFESKIKQAFFCGVGQGPFLILWNLF